MAGQIHRMIDRLIQQRSNGNAVAAAGVRVRLLLRGIDPDDYNGASEDDPTVIARLEEMIAEFEQGAPNQIGGFR